MSGRLAFETGRRRLRPEFHLSMSERMTKTISQSTRRPSLRLLRKYKMVLEVVEGSCRVKENSRSLLDLETGSDADMPHS